MTEYRPPDPADFEPIRGEPRDPTNVEGGGELGWSPATIFGGLCILAVTVTVCLIVLHVAGVI